MTQQALLRIGTRGSPLALAQTAEVATALAAAHAELAPPGAIETVTIRTTGDKVLDRSPNAIGGKAIFTKEIEEALLDRRIDIAVHSSKDMPTVLPSGLLLAGCLPREDPRDAFLSLHADSLRELAYGAVVGTSSLRRRAQILHERAGLEVVAMRGNIETRIKKLDAGEVDAAVLALAGLKRLHLEGRATAIVPVEEMLPAPAQGAIALEICVEDERAARYVTAINHAPSSLCVAAERAFVAELGGDCRMPIAALAQIEGGMLQFRAALFKPDGSTCLMTARDGAPGEALALATDAGRELSRRAGPGFFA
jgi:hydroxymethylbilane synthase